MPNPEAMTDPAGAVERLTRMSNGERVYDISRMKPDLREDVRALISRITELEKAAASAADTIAAYLAQPVHEETVGAIMDLGRARDNLRAAARTLANKDG